MYSSSDDDEYASGMKVEYVNGKPKVTYVQPKSKYQSRGASRGAPRNTTAATTRSKGAVYSEVEPTRRAPAAP